MAFHYWQYFKALELSLEDTTRYVEPTFNNYKTYSIEFARTLLIACSEIDVICKLLCQQINSTKSPENINEYRKIIIAKYPNFYKMKIIAPSYGIEFYPWAWWENNENPYWWKSHTDVKHKRSIYFEKANLINTYNALAGLLCLLFYYYKPEFYELKIMLTEKLFSIENGPAHLVDDFDYNLPDFPTK